MVEAVTTGVPSWNDVGGTTVLPTTVFADQFPGADAGTKINNAIAAVPPGGTVDVTNLQGNQTIAATILLNKPVRLVFGCGTFTGSVDPLISITASDTVITSVTPKCTCIHQNTPPGNMIKINAGINHILIENICVEGSAALPNMPGGFNQTYTPIWSAGLPNQIVTDLTIRNCFIGNGTVQMALEYTDYSHIVNNEFVATAPPTLGAPGPPGIAEALLIAGAHNVIDGNTFQTTGNVSSIILNAVPATNQNVFYGAYYNTYSNNILTALTPLNNEALVLSPGAHCTVSHNTLKLATVVSTAGIALYAPFTITLPIHCEYNTVIGNTIDMADGTFTAVPQFGIALSSGTTDTYGVNHNTVVGNTVSSPGTPMVISGGSNNIVSGNVFNVTGGSTNVDPVIVAGAAASAVDNVIIGNTIANGTGFGEIDVYSNAGAVYIHGNKILGNATTQVNGIVFQSNSGANSFVSGNAFSRHLGYGIFLQANAGPNIAIGTNYFVDADMILGRFNLGAAVKGSPVVGSSLADNAPTGFVGEFISASLPSTSALALTTVTLADILSISLTAGDWDVSGTASFKFGAGTTYQFLWAGITTVASNFPAAQDLVMLSVLNGTPNSASDISVATPTTRINVSTASTAYLAIYTSFAGGTLSSYGALRVRRVR